MSNLTRYENRARNTHDIDPDHDGKIDGFKTSDRTRYNIDCNSRWSIWIWFKSGLKLAWFYPFSFALFCLTMWYVIRPIVFTAPVALLRNNPKVLTEKEAGGEFNALVNNTVVGVRGFTGTALDATQEAQIKANTQNSDRRPAENLVPKARVEFVDN
jgi:hypothetical protein